MKRSRLKRRSRLRFRSPKRATVKELDRLARRLIVEIRDLNTCQRCGATAATHKIDWSHVQNRQAKSIQWAEWNSLALCAGCHFWFDGDNRKAAREEWWANKWPDRAVRWGAWRAQRRRAPVDFGAVKAYLEQRLALALQ